MTQEEFNLIVRAVTFASSTDACMDTDAMDGAIDALNSFITEYPEFMERLDFKSLNIFNTDPTCQEDPDINIKLLEMFDGKLENHD